MTYRHVLLLICAALAACAGGGERPGDQAAGFQPDKRPLARTMVYECAGYEFIARLGPGEMAVWLPDRYLVLSQVRSASGTRYQEGDVEFWSSGDEAMLTVAGQAYRYCALAPHRAPWEDARRRGVDFRAVGNEPAWSLEIRNGDHLLFDGGSGMRRVASPDPGQQLNGQIRTWHAVTESADLQVEVEDNVCTDSMSGQKLPSKVTVTLDGHVYSGCGRGLDYPWE
jgi:putative lipoprotein